MSIKLKSRTRCLVSTGKNSNDNLLMKAVYGIAALAYALLVSFLSNYLWEAYRASK